MFRAPVQPGVQRLELSRVQSAFELHHPQARLFAQGIALAGTQLEADDVAHRQSLARSREAVVGGGIALSSASTWPCRSISTITRDSPLATCFSTVLTLSSSWSAISLRLSP